MASKAVAKISAAAAKTAAEISAETYQYPWREKLQKYKHELARGVWGSWHLGASLRRKSMVSKAVAKISAAAAAKTAAEISAETYQYPWREKLQKYKHELARGVWGSWHLGASLRRKSMVSKAVAKISAAAAKTSAEISAETYQYPWREKLQKYKHELARGVWGSWHLGAWKPLAISARKRARLRKEVLLAGEDWPYDPPKGEMRTKRKGHKVDRIASEKRANTAELMKKMPDMLLDYKKRVWEKRMKAEDAKD